MITKKHPVWLTTPAFERLCALTEQTGETKVAALVRLVMAEPVTIMIKPTVIDEPTSTVQPIVVSSEPRFQNVPRKPAPIDMPDASETCEAASRPPFWNDQPRVISPTIRGRRKST